MIKYLLKKLNERKQRKLHQKCLLMNNEILCAIISQVRKEQEKATVNIPAFLEVQNRYDNLHIRTHQDVINVYKAFFQLGLVTGINL